jgi:hypothetical protein
MPRKRITRSRVVRYLAMAVTALALCLVEGAFAGGAAVAKPSAPAKPSSTAAITAAATAAKKQLAGANSLNEGSRPGKQSVLMIKFPPCNLPAPSVMRKRHLTRWGCLRINPSQFGHAPKITHPATATGNGMRAADVGSPPSVCPATPSGDEMTDRFTICIYTPASYTFLVEENGTLVPIGTIYFDVEMWAELSPQTQSWATNLIVTPTSTSGDVPEGLLAIVSMSCTDSGCTQESASPADGIMPWVIGQQETASYGFSESVASGGTVSLDNVFSVEFGTTLKPSVIQFGDGLPNPIRCDNTINVNGYQNGGCVIPSYKPTWTVNDTLYPAMGLVAKHMAMATGNLPGYSGLSGLPGVSPNFLTYDPGAQDANRAAYCDNATPPAWEEAAGNTTCDEYPMASTQQGAASNGPFSICWVPSTANSSQGGAFNQGFINPNRLLPDDDFYMNATYTGNQPGCGAGSNAGGTASVNIDKPWSNLFQSYGDTNGGWSGGDGAQSVKLPDGNTAWFFGDTYLGDISPDGTHGPLSTGIAHNTSVVYNASTGSLGPVNAQPPGNEGYFFLEDYTWVPPPSGYPSSQYEIINGDQVIDNGTLYKIYQLADRGIHPDGFQYKLVGNVLESFSINGDTLTPTGGVPIGVQDSSGSNPIIWGTAVLTPGDGYIYIYGTQPYNANAPSASAYPLYVARVPVGDLSVGAADWQYYAAAAACSPPASAWSSNPSAASQLMPGGTSSGFSVTNVNGVDVLLTNDSTGTSNNAVAYYANCPTGFSAASPKYQIYAPSVPNGYLTYEYRIMPQFSNGANVVVSYSTDTERVDASCMGENYYDSSIYRPRFLDVTLPGIGTYGGGVTDPPNNPPPTYTAPAVSPDAMYAPTDPYPYTSLSAQQFCVPGQTPVKSPSLTVTGNSGGVMDLSWSLQPSAMWMYSVVYCNETYWAAQGTACPSNLVGPPGNDLTQAIPACSNQVASNPNCGFNLIFGNTSSTLTDLDAGDLYEVQVETTLAVEGGMYVGSNVVTETGNLPMVTRASRNQERRLGSVIIRQGQRPGRTRGAGSDAQAQYRDSAGVPLVSCVVDSCVSLGLASAPGAPVAVSAGARSRARCRRWGACEACDAGSGSHETPGQTG